MNNNTIVLYHGGCRDGFCAAWVVNKYFNSISVVNNVMSDIRAEFIPAYYGQEPPNCKDKDVIIVDFCYDLETMKKIAYECKNLIWLDHHKTAISFFEFLEENGYQWGTRLDYRFRNDKSGAGIAWDYFFPNESRPWLVDYVEDRDLWAKKLPDTDIINSYIATMAFDFPAWDIVNDGMTKEQAANYGIVAEAKTRQYVLEVCKNVYFVDINQSNIRDVTGHVMVHSEAPDYRNIPIVNICQVDCSEVLHELCKRYSDSPFSLYWFKRQDGLYQYGLRSIGDFDVSTIAKLFGGGGHKNAAGFQLPYLLEELK